MGITVDIGLTVMLDCSTVLLDRPEFFAAALLEPSWSGSMTVLAIIITVLVADIFFDLDIIAILALFAVSIYVSLLIDVTWRWQVLSAILIWLLFSLIFYFGWRAVARPLSKAFGSKVKESSEQSEGQECTFRLIDNKQFCYWNGDLWPAKLAREQIIEDGDKALIVKSESGFFTINRLKKHDNTNTTESLPDN